MNALFADTSFYLALLNPRDRHHRRAVESARKVRRPIVTTEFVLVEVGNALSGTPRGRDRFVTFVDRVSGHGSNTVVPASHQLFAQGSELYRSRNDKTWSLTDCISFVVMNEHGLTEALTADHHFEQAGFTVLLK